jgi:hypothetical protein
MFSFSQDEWECDLNLTYPPFKLNGLRTSHSCILHNPFEKVKILASPPQVHLEDEGYAILSSQYKWIKIIVSLLNDYNLV